MSSVTEAVSWAASSLGFSLPGLPLNHQVSPALFLPSPNRQILVDDSSDEEIEKEVADLSSPCRTPSGLSSSGSVASAARGSHQASALFSCVDTMTLLKQAQNCGLDMSVDDVS